MIDKKMVKRGNCSLIFPFIFTFSIGVAVGVMFNDIVDSLSADEYSVIANCFNLWGKRCGLVICALLFIIIFLGLILIITSKSETD